MNVVREIRYAPENNREYAAHVIAAMQDMVVAGMQDKAVQDVARALMGTTARETVQNDWDYLKQRIRYVNDPEDLERVTSARFTIGHGVPEDCDGMATAAATLLALQGINATFAAVAWRKPEFTHVMALVYLDKNPLPFDLTLDTLGETHDPLNILELPTMPRIETISDYALSDRATDLRSLAAGLTSRDDQTRRESFATLSHFYPVEMQRWLSEMARNVNVSTRRGLSDGMGDLLGTILKGASDLVGAVLSPITGGASIVGSQVLNQVVPSGGGDSSGPPADPQRPGRSVTDARTYMEEIPQIYPSKYAPLGSPSLGGDDPMKQNYSSVFQIPNTPKVDQNTFNEHPAHIFLSWDDSGTWISDFKTLVANPVGTGYELSYVGEDGRNQASPGYYVATPFSDGAMRFDFVGLNPGDLPARVSTTPQAPDASKSTANQATTGGQLPDASNSPANGLPLPTDSKGNPLPTSLPTSILSGFDLSGNLPLIALGVVALILILKK